MQAFVNKTVLEQTSFDSAAPGGLAALVHRFSDPGQYVLTFLRDEHVIARYPLAVLAEPPKEEALPQQVSFDLEKLRRPLPERPAPLLAPPPAAGPPTLFVLGVGGYARFTSSRREVGYAIAAEGAAGHAKAERFDSRRLGAADLFAVTLLRPGAYSLTNTLTGAKGRITVAYPALGKEPYRPPAPLSVQCAEHGFAPATSDLQPAQGIIFRFAVPSRIKIDLVTPNDGPGKAVQRQARPVVQPEQARRPFARWTKPPGKA